MTDRHSEAGDNQGRCESCNDPKTTYQRQSTFPVYLAAMGWGTLWLCDACLTVEQKRYAGQKLGPGNPAPKPNFLG